MPTFSTPRGTSDILPEEWPYWNFVIGHAIEVAQLYGYRRIETPILGDTSLFTRSSGGGTDIVDKEMYSFRDRGGDDLSLRPEGTAPVMRAYLQHGMDRLPQPVKLFYIERMYRYDRPQRGRYREHRQFGCEAIGAADAYVDVEMIDLLRAFYRRIGLKDISLHLNSIGDPECRPAYLEALVSYLQVHIDALSEQDRTRVARNPLRVLDSKDHASQGVIAEAPHMLDFLCSNCRQHWEKVLRGLSLLRIDYVIDHRLVRGLDYYTRTVFEFTPGSDASQAVVGAGGRYDALAEALGAKHVPGIGFGSGIERLILNVKESGADVPDAPKPRIFVAHAGQDTEDAALMQAAQVRAAGIPADMAFGAASLKSQMKRANGSGSEYAAIVGKDEMRDGTVTLRDLCSGDQETLPSPQLLNRLQSD